MYLKFIRDSVPEAMVGYNPEGTLGRPEFVVICSDESKVNEAVRIIYGLFDGLQDDPIFEAPG